MIRELYKLIVTETALNITNTRIDSVRNKHITKSCCRIYENGYIGIAGTLGDETEETWKQAYENLSMKIAYPYEHTRNMKKERDLRSGITEKEFIENTEKLLEIIRSEYPEFIFGNKIKLTEETDILSNDDGLNLVNKDAAVLMEFTVKHVDSINVFDTAVLRLTRTWNNEEIMKEIREQLDAYNNPVELPDNGHITVGITTEEIKQKLVEYLDGRSIGKKASGFSDKIGSKVFSDELTIYVDRTDENILIPFFDSEGMVLGNGKFKLIENGVIKCGYCDKRNSKEFNVPDTASAGGEYDDVPSIDETIVHIENTGKTVDELISEKEWILPVIMAGGDCTNEGDFSSPVQFAYLMRGKKYIGRLPEFTLSGNFYKYFNEDFVGYSSDRAVFGERVCFVKMNISR